MGRKEDDRIRRLAKKKGFKASKKSDPFGNPVWSLTDDKGKELRTRDNENKLTPFFFEDEALEKLEED